MWCRRSQGMPWVQVEYACMFIAWANISWLICDCDDVGVIINNDDIDDDDDDCKLRLLNNQPWVKQAAIKVIDPKGVGLLRKGYCRKEFNGDTTRWATYRHRRSQDFFLGCTFFLKKVDLFSRRPPKPVLRLINEKSPLPAKLWGACAPTAPPGYAYAYRAVHLLVSFCASSKQRRQKGCLLI